MTPSHANIRLFLHAAEAKDKPHLGHDYLVAMDDASLRVRALGIQHVALGASPKFRGRAHLFSRPMAEKRYINVVCAPCDFPIVTRELRVEDLKPVGGGDDELTHRMFPGTRGDASDQEVVMKPKTAFQALFTVGVVNIAITLPPTELSESERHALSHYRVIAPTEGTAGLLHELGVSHAATIPPAPEAVGPYFSDLLP